MIELYNKLKKFPPINFISIKESEDRRSILYKKNEEYGLSITPHIFEKYKDEDHNITGSDCELVLGTGRGPVTSHLKAIKNWYERTDDEYGFFCEDDASFETIKYWNFTWEEFIDRLPPNWECIQLSLTREHHESFNIPNYIENIRYNISYFFIYDFHMRYRCWCDWSCVAYILKRSHAKELLENYYSENTFCLEYKGIEREFRPEWALRPVAETIIYTTFKPNTIYTFPLFVENSEFETTINPDTNYICIRNICAEAIVDWWKDQGKDFSLDQIINNSLLNQ